jgi:site-specific DNA recombinase
VAELRNRGITSKLRTLKTGETVGDIPLTRGPLAYLLRNRFYIGEVSFKGEVLKGEQPAIVDRALFDAVQTKLEEQNNSYKTTRMKSEALLAGRIFDDRGNRMSRAMPASAASSTDTICHPPCSRVSPPEPDRCPEYRPSRSRHRSSQPSGSISNWRRLPTTPASSRRMWFASRSRQTNSSFSLLRHKRPSGVARVPGHPLLVPWHKTPSIRRREILLPDNDSSQIQNARPIRSETRATLVASIARGRGWLNELTAGPKATTDSIAKRERCSPRKINKTISLAFLAPKLVKAAIEGRLPDGMGVARLFDIPAEWSRQRKVLGLTAR